MNHLYLSLGSNLGNRQAILREAVLLLENQIGSVCCLSDFYETAPWGFLSENQFLNAAIYLQTELTPDVILQKTQEIEKQLGRKHKSVNAQYQDRTLDIDLLFYNTEVFHRKIVFPDQRVQDLCIPHPLMAERDFVLKPLVEIAPNFVHPVLHESIRELWQKWHLKNAFHLY